MDMTWSRTGGLGHDQADVTWQPDSTRATWANGSIGESGGPGM